MPSYKYTAIDPNGKRINGSMQAANALEIEHRLANSDLDLIALSENRSSRFKVGRQKLNRKQIINIVFQLEQLTKSGVPLLDGLKDLRDTSEPSYYKDVLTGLVENIEGGSKFSNALEEFPSDFDDVFVSLIRVGEESGELPRILRDMCSTLRWQDELIATTVKILMYPVIVALVVFAVTTFLMVYLVPQIVPFVNEMGTEIPGHTKLLIAISDFFVSYWWAVLIFPLISIFLLKLIAKTNVQLRLRIDHLKLKLPVFGRISYNIKIARLANYMSLLYASGITVLNALDICKQLVSNAKLSASIEEVKQHINDGRGISESFSQVHVFPPLVIRMLSVGESTGNLDEALTNVRYYYDREVNDTIDKIEPTINPLLTVIMGVLLGWIMLAVLGPVWDAVSSVS